MAADLLDTPIEYLKGVGPKRAEIMRKELGISTYYDLLTYYPFRYIDRSRILKIIEVSSDVAYIQIKGRITNLQLVGKGGGMRYIMTLRDETGLMDLVWFQGIAWIKDKYPVGTELIAFGKPALYAGRFNIPHPELELASDYYSAPADPLHPLYNTSEKIKQKGINSRVLSRLAKSLINQLEGLIPETLPSELLDTYKLVSREQALLNIHYPVNLEMLGKAEARLKFEELFFIQLRLLRYKVNRSEKVKGVVFEHVGSIFNEFYSKYLPFPLTNAQKKVIREIRSDLGSGRQMNRLLQGDVGSGKTLVALMSMLIALDNGFQACLMAPTEILATQHYKTISRFLDGMDVKLDLLTGSTRKAQRKEMHKLLQTGELHLLMGTHALIEDTVRFNRLGLVVIDEQHRFGVEQRARLWNKSETPPHVLVMTATPIPRTLAMTVYGDLDYSVIDELPPGRKPVKTYHFYENGHEKVYKFMKQQIDLGRQIYVVYPLIEESETLDLKNLQEGFEIMEQIFPKPRYNVSMVHGKLKPEVKEEEMQKFIRGETHIMVATTVIEVGVDVPNASVMVIENAERFGLSQLHQLRGRVGRGADQSHCLLMTSFKLSSDAKIRVDTMVKTNDGFEISDVDLKLRGPGDLEGTQQSGVLDLKIANIIRDEAVLRVTRTVAQQILDDDPHLTKEKNRKLLAQLDFLNRKTTDWAMIS